MAIELDSEQIAAIEKLQTGSILLGGVGSGKTRTALAYYYTKVLGGKLKINGVGKTVMPIRQVPLYVITTARNRNDENWIKESIAFYNVKPIVDSWNNIAKYRDIRDAFFIFDEQRVVGVGSWSKNFIRIARNNEWIMLSATPGDVWMDYASVFIANGFYRNFTDFRYQHVVYSRYTKYPKIERYINVEKLEYFRKKILVVMETTRHTIRHHKDILVPYDADITSNIIDNRWNVLKDCPIQNASELCSLMRRIVNGDIRRLNTLKSIMKEHPKVIIFYNFDYELEILIDLFENDILYKSKSFQYSQWNGHKHEPIPKTDRWAYLVQYTAGAEAWNCIETDTIIFYSQNYSYKVMEQAAGRIDRKNTPFTDLYYYHLISDSPIDRSIKRALDRKEKFNERVYFEKTFM